MVKGWPSGTNHVLNRLILLMASFHHIFLCFTVGTIHFTNMLWVNYVNYYVQQYAKVREQFESELFLLYFCSETAKEAMLQPPLQISFGVVRENNCSFYTNASWLWPFPGRQRVNHHSTFKPFPSQEQWVVVFSTVASVLIFLPLPGRCTRFFTSLPTHCSWSSASQLLQHTFLLNNSASSSAFSRPVCRQSSSHLISVSISQWCLRRYIYEVGLFNKEKL